MRGGKARGDVDAVAHQIAISLPRAITVRIVLAMTGATGAVYGVRLLAALTELGVERHLILSHWAEVTLLKEMGHTARDVGAMASVLHSRDNQGASISSGSFRHDGMIVAPCSMKTLAAIRFGLPTA